MNAFTNEPKLDLQKRYGGRALVTGAARGIGRALSEALAADGYDLLLVDREAEEVRALARMLTESSGVDAVAVPFDLTRRDLPAEAERWASEYDIGLLVNNAGLSPMDPFFEIPIEEHLATLEVNARATLILTHALGRAMMNRGRGAIVIMSSASALSGAPFFAHYAATKAYGLTLAASLWSELERTGIDVLAVCPGLTRTTPVEARSLHRSRPRFIPMGEPEAVARGALRAIGKQPMVVPTVSDRVSASLLSRFLPRRWALSLVRRSMEQMRGR